MLTGAPPFEAPSHMTIMMKQMSEPAPLVQGRAPDCPADLAAVIDRMLAKESFDRFATMEDVVETLDAGTVTSTHKVRTQLVSFALADPRREQLKRVSTPRSPIPTAARRSRVDDTRAPRSIRPLAIGAAVVILAAGALLVVNRDRDRAQSRAPVTTAPSPAVPAPGEPGPPAPRQEEPAAAPTVSLPVPPPSPPRTPPAATPEPRAAIPDRGARARAGERATIPDTAAGVTQHDQVAIATESVVAVSLDPASLALMSGESAGLAAHATGTSGRVLERPVEWRSNAPLVATVTAAGKVAAVGPGVAIISAVVGGRAGSAAVTVTAAPSDAPPQAVAAETPVSDAERRTQITAMVQAYARAIESRDIARVRQFYPAMPAAREQQLRQALTTMEKLQVRLVVGQILADDNATSVHVTGIWSFTSHGQRNTLPADDRYQVERRGDGWVITDIR